MICISTRGVAPAVSFREALLSGLAPDGGLYVPQRLPVLDPAVWTAARGASMAEVGTVMLGPLIGDEIGLDALKALLADAFNFPVPVVALAEGLSAVELFHGPTFAFKDVGARVLARLMSHLHGEGQAPLTVLVATSGDTGGAVAHAFHGVPHTRVVVLYPHGQVSAVQEAQFTTLGGNVMAVAVAGSFDDCQRMAKQAFSSRDLRERAHLTSANSISVGRLLPQMVYYGLAAARADAGAPLVIAVPSGNFGNLAAGLMAMRMGAPIDAFHAATTINDTVPRYLRSGVVEPKPSVTTIANAMDVGNPSNLERIRWMFDGDLEALRDVVTASVHADDAVRGAIKDLDSRLGYLADPHTAIAYLGATEVTVARPDVQVQFLATAHPAKFGGVVEPITGRPVPLPAALAEAMSRPRQVVHITPDLEALAALL